MAHISIYKIVRKTTLCYCTWCRWVDILVLHLREGDGSPHISISRIVRKMTLCYLVQVDDVLVLHLREGDGSHKYF